MDNLWEILGSLNTKMFENAKWIRACYSVNSWKEICQWFDNDVGLLVLCATFRDPRPLALESEAVVCHCMSNLGVIHDTDTALMASAKSSTTPPKNEDLSNKQWPTAGLPGG